MSREQAVNLEPSNTMHVISISDVSKKSPPLKDGFNSKLFLKFDDATEESVRLSEGEVPDLAPGHRSGHRIVINGEELCDYSDASKIYRFIQNIENEEALHDVIVHCEQGVSRSAAVAQFIADKFNGQLISSNNYSTRYMNKRLYRLLNKVFNNNSNCSYSKDFPTCFDFKDSGFKKTVSQIKKIHH